ncbi:hypothetical protein [Kitasatospora paranensis]|uniref:Uncharacterized protein n=1 Tax=Kitasatospora paranensis TaxID=258053 RepID=A0ABW2FSH1_9ACTN
MVLVHLLLASAGRTPGTPAEAAVLEDALWAHAAPRHALEHVRVRSFPHGLGVALFVRGLSATAAERSAADLVTLVVRTTPDAAGYSVVSGPAATP